MARFQFGDGQVRKVRYVAGTEVGIAGRRSAFAALALVAATPALLRKGAIEALDGQSDLARDVSTIRNRGVDIHLERNEMGRSVLSVIAFGKGPSCVDRGPKSAASESA